MAEASVARVSRPGRGLQVVKSQLRLVTIQVRLLDQPQLGTGAVVGGGCRLERDGPIDLRNCLLATVEHAEGLGPQDMGKSLVLEHRDRRGEVCLGLGNVISLQAKLAPGDVHAGAKVSVQAPGLGGPEVGLGRLGPFADHGPVLANRLDQASA